MSVDHELQSCRARVVAVPPVSSQHKRPIAEATTEEKEDLHGRIVVQQFIALLVHGRQCAQNDIDGQSSVAQHDQVVYIAADEERQSASQRQQLVCVLCANEAVRRSVGTVLDLMFVTRSM